MSTSSRPHACSAGAAAVAAALLLVASACGSSSPSAPTEPCSYTLSSTSQAFTADSGRGSVTVATRPDCGWSVGGAGDWLTLTSNATSTGPGAVDYAVTANGGAAREKALTIAGNAYTVRQDAAVACTFTIDPDRREFARNGGAGTVAVTTAAACAWTAESGVPWIEVAPPPRGNGAGLLSYTVAENNGTAARTGTITVAGHAHAVEQRGEGTSPACEYRVSPVEFGPCMDSATGTVTVTTTDACRWTATAQDSWLSVTGGRSGTGSGTITFAWTENYLAPRHGVVMVRWPTTTLGQNVHVEQAGCHYAVSPSAIDVHSAGGAVTFDVYQESEPNVCGGPLQDRCVWRAAADASWITVTTSMPTMGDHRVSLTVAPNGGAARTGHVTVGDETVTVTQASGA